MNLDEEIDALRQRVISHEPAAPVAAPPVVANVPSPARDTSLLEGIDEEIAHLRASGA
jgi:hypothetical protein